MSAFHVGLPSSGRSAIGPVAVVVSSRADVRCWCNPVEGARRCRDAAFALIDFAAAEAYPLSAACCGLEISYLKPENI
jgi:hypothetical protein